LGQATIPDEPLGTHTPSGVGAAGIFRGSLLWKNTNSCRKRKAGGAQITNSSGTGPRVRLGSTRRTRIVNQKKSRCNYFLIACAVKRKQGAEPSPLCTTPKPRVQKSHAEECTKKTSWGKTRRPRQRTPVGGLLGERLLIPQWG